ncbi:calcium-dependent protein kinase 2 [Cyclospora cayetanensis]|uniref:non-specific serine/threonine protein kinase n=1 Tax=Cyclospora cayetanensis TaxID=88456 RepID=A0A6P6RZL3_9EIME|nr:calcium-dependent protein kinase 2 [Cyclospora cayetanensis]
MQVKAAGTKRMASANGSCESHSPTPRCPCSARLLSLVACFLSPCVGKLLATLEHSSSLLIALREAAPPFISRSAGNSSTGSLCSLRSSTATASRPGGGASTETVIVEPNRRTADTLPFGQMHSDAKGEYVALQTNRLRLCLDTRREARLKHQLQRLVGEQTSWRRGPGERTSTSALNSVFFLGSVSGALLAEAAMAGRYKSAQQQHLLRQSLAVSQRAGAVAAEPRPRGILALSAPPLAMSNPPPELIRRKLEQVMHGRENFRKSAAASFRQFDTSGSGVLRFSDVAALVRRLCSNLQLPPVDESALRTIFDAFDSSGSGCLELEDFCMMYWEILCRIREKYYPEKQMRVRRSLFVGRRNLALAGISITDLFTFAKKLGSGSFGDVHRVIEKSSGLERVIKTINKDRSQVPLEQIEAEIEVLKSLDHPNIIKIFEVFDDYHNVYIVMETCEGGELLQRLIDAQNRGSALTEKSVSEIMRQLMNALAYFHSKHVAHKDLKPENVLFQDSSPDSPIKVIDFGLAELFEKTDAHSKNAAGTALYMAPEVFMRYLSLKCDIWSAGVMMYFLLTGCLPFIGNTIEEVKDKVCNSEPDYARECAHLTGEAVSLLKWMLIKPEDERPTATEVLKHPWFNQANVKVIQISPLICENMKKYMRQSHLKNALVNMMVHQLNVTGPQIRQINDIFRQLDKDGDGTISHTELTEGLEQVGLPQWDINRIIQSVDVDDSGNVSYTEFLAACYSWQESELNVIWTAFQKMDKDGDGKISVPEFEAVLGGDDYRLVPKDTVKALVAQIDRNGDGQVDWDEFLHYMKLN